MRLWWTALLVGAASFWHAYAAARWALDNKDRSAPSEGQDT